MPQEPKAWLIVEKGKADGGERLELKKEVRILGRASSDHLPTFTFPSHFISRMHAEIVFKEGSFFLTDRESKHGTEVNDERLPPGDPWKLKNQDRISLAKGVVVLTFDTRGPTGPTQDFPESPSESPPDSILNLDLDRREFILDGKPLTLRGKVLDLLLLLYENQGKAVSTRTIKIRVWPERELGVDGMPQVTNQEVTTLVYRLRKKLEPHKGLVHNVPRFGYMLDLEQSSPDSQHSG